MSGELRLKAEETAVVTIDMHRGHLDMEVATMPAKPEDAKRVIASEPARLMRLASMTSPTNAKPSATANSTCHGRVIAS